MKVYPISLNSNFSYKGNAAISHTVVSSENPKQLSQDDFPIGINCSALYSGLNTKKYKKIPEIIEAKKNGQDISSDREALIFKRIKSAVLDAEKFCSQHEGFSKDDVIQDLIVFVLMATNKQLDEKNTNYTACYQQQADAYFKKLLSSDVCEPIDKYKNTKDVSTGIITETDALQADINCFLKEHLTPKEQDIIKKLYGLDGEQKMTQENIAKIYNVTQQAIQEASKKVLAKLREVSENDI